MMTREICKVCFNENPVGFDVSDEIWEQVRPGDINILCISCFAKIADSKLIAWDKNIKLYPVSLKSFNTE